MRPVSIDDDRLARASRLLRQRGHLRQADLLGRRYVTQEIEAGRSGQLKVDAVRRHFAQFDASVRMTAWWNGAALDRLLDEAHAGVVEATARTLSTFGFKTRTEFSFSDYGERGSIDIFGGHEGSQAIFVGEAKSDWGSIEETLRRQDVKTRLAPKLAESAFGWKPVALASVLVFPDKTTARRVAARYEASLTAYPARGREIRVWLRRPSGKLGGIWFLSNAELVGHANGQEG
jgi:hypothetical protein